MFKVDLLLPQLFLSSLNKTNIVLFMIIIRKYDVLLLRVKGCDRRERLIRECFGLTE